MVEQQHTDQATDNDSLVQACLITYLTCLELLRDKEKEREMKSCSFSDSVTTKMAHEPQEPTQK